MDYATQKAKQLAGDTDVSLSDFYKILEANDWWTDFSDDHRDWQEGNAKSAWLMKVAEVSSAHDAMYKEYVAYVFSGPAWGSEKKEKPAAPEELETA